MDWKRRRTLPTSDVKRVCIVGGTHGNESNGVHLAKHFQRNPKLVSRPSFETEVFLANNGAIQANTRYVDEDLNRCYLLADLTDESKAALNSERKRAREMDQLLGPKSSETPRCDLVIDLHNTTAATGVALMMAPDDEFAHELAYHLMSLDDTVRVVNWNAVPDWAVCPSIGRSGMTFEVGPCPWGCVIPDSFQRSRQLVCALLDYVEEHNKIIAGGKFKREEAVLPVYRSIGIAIDYPRNKDGDLEGMVHPDLQFQDFKELKDGDGLFLTFDGEPKEFKREDYKVPPEHEKVYALFVNEAAYYEKKTALMLTTKIDAPCTVLKAA